MRSIPLSWDFEKSSESSSGCKSTIIRPSTYFSAHLAVKLSIPKLNI